MSGTGEGHKRPEPLKGGGTWPEGLSAAQLPDVDKARPKAPLFLEKALYRRRRMADALRALPVLSGALFMFPLFWRGGEAAASVPTVRVMIYIFVAWVCIAGLSGLLSYLLGNDLSGLESEDDLRWPR